MAAQTDLVEVLGQFDPKLVKMCPAGNRAENWPPAKAGGPCRLPHPFNWQAIHVKTPAEAAQVNSKALQRVSPHIPASIPKERLSHQAEIALASFKAGVCVSANLSIGQFDSHANNDTDQMKLIPEFLAGIAYVIRRADELKLRDKLVVIMQSEMGRTPTYSQGNGNDHWSVGSIMFLGPGIKGNRVIGATDERQFGVPLHPQSLAWDREKGIKIRPEHIHTSLQQCAGIAAHPLSEKFPLGVAAKETLRGFWG